MVPSFCHFDAYRSTIHCRTGKVERPPWVLKGMHVVLVLGRVSGYVSQDEVVSSIDGLLEVFLINLSPS